jgi:DNA helicase-2/ATP-dependent DNA helicase PcrA
VVFIVGMEEGLLPHQRSMEDPSEMEEERRLCYVGVTRAKERLYLLSAFRRGFRGGAEPGIPSRFLADIPRELLVTPQKPRGRKPVYSGQKSVQSRTFEVIGEQFTADGAADTETTATDIRTGDKVRHTKFGDGIVVSRVPSGADFEITVAFKEGHGVKRLLLSFAPLEKVE